MRASILSSLTLLLAVLPPSARAIDVLSATSLAPENAEIVDYSPISNTLASTVSATAAGGFGVKLFTLNADGTLTERAVIAYDDVFSGSVANMLSASSCALDPKGRGFGAVALIPAANGTTLGKVAFFDFKATTTATAQKLKVLDVGFHPDSVKFTPDGSKLIVANEGERTTGGSADAPGSISIIDLTGVTTAANIAAATFTQARVTTFDFQAANLAAGVNLSLLRYNDAFPMAAVDYFRAIEPEYLAPMNDKVYVTLQENNAIAEFTYSLGKWTAVRPLGTITQTVDASDQDGVSNAKLLSIDETVPGLPMPDGIVAFETGGQRYLVTVNEGDARPDDGDISRVSAAGVAPTSPKIGMPIDPTVFASGINANNRLARLNISLVDGDTDNDGDIDVPTMIGTRSFSIWNAATGALVWDSGSLETPLATLAPLYHNINNGLLSDWDTRSDDKGPEPEALAVGTYGGSILAFVGLERQNGILIYNITNPSAPVLIGYQNHLDRGIFSPESLVFLPANGSPTAKPLLVAGFEGTGTTGNGIVVHNLYDRNDVLVYKVATARNWNQDQVFYPSSPTPLVRNSIAGVVKDTAYLILDRTTSTIRTIKYFTRIEDGASIKEYTMDTAAYAPWDVALPAPGQWEFLQTLAPGTNAATASLKMGETLTANDDLDLEGDSTNDRGTSTMVSYLIGGAKDMTFGKAPNSVLLPKVPSKMTGVARSVLDAELDDADGAGPMGAMRRVFFRSSGAQTATLDTVLTTQVMTVLPAGNTGLVLGDLNYATSAVTALLDKLGYDAAQP